MENEGKEKLEVVKKSKSAGTSIALSGIPFWVHKRVKDFQVKISYERGKKFTLKETYVEFLKDAAKDSK